VVNRIIPLGLVAFALCSGPAFGQSSCESLASLKLPHTTITSSRMVSAGPLSNTQAMTVPEHCEVKGIIRPTKDSEIQFAVWLPPIGWNGKYLQVGNGGWAGSVPDRNMIDPLSRGYATAGTDDGHEGGNGAAWAIGHPEKLIDFGYRAVHETNVQSRAIVYAFYGRDASLSYFVGCSDGGREALMEAQRYPADFNGIIAGAPANNWSHLFTGFDGTNRQRWQHLPAVFLRRNCRPFKMRCLQHATQWMVSKTLFWMTRVLAASILGCCCVKRPRTRNV